MTRHRVTCGLLLWAVLGILAGCGPMTPQQQEGVALRRYCEQNPLADPEACYAFIGNPP
jgi:hypothetical protein